MKTKPYGVRFDEDLLKKIKKKEKLTSPQQVVNFLMKWYEQVHFGIAGPAASVTPEAQKEQSEQGKGLAHPTLHNIQFKKNPTVPKDTAVIIDNETKEVVAVVTQTLKNYDKLIPTVSTKPALEALRDEILEHPTLTPAIKQKLIPRIESKMKFLK